MNFYSDEVFCEALATAYFPEQKVEPKLFELEGKLWKIPTINGTQPIFKFPFQSTFIDFYEPCEQALSAAKGKSKKISYIPKACHGIVSTKEWFENNLDKVYKLPAPTVIWQNFESWDQFVKFVREKRSNFFADSRRRSRNLERDLGSLKFVFDDRRPEVLTTCIDWKSEQYHRSEHIDTFAYQEHVKLFQELNKKGLLLVSSLSAGEKLVAAHIGVLWKGRMYYWIPAYDFSYTEYSPGRLLLLFMLEESFRHKHEEFDFLIGDEPYKWFYATHARLIDEMGYPSIPVRLSRSIKSVIKPMVLSSLKPFPGLKESLKPMRQQIRSKLYQLMK